MSNWSETDACLALDEALSDPGLTPARKQELMQAVIALCVTSPSAFRRLVAYGKQSLLAGDLVRRAREASIVHPKGAAFRDWLDLQPDLQPRPQAQHPVLLTRSQRAAWEALDETASLYFSGQLRFERIQPRTSRLIAGPSGVGKSHLVRTYAKEKGYGFLLLTFGSWLPGGSRGEETTAERVLKFLSVNERCIISIDELDKINTGLRHEWAVSVQNDLFALLDRTWFHSQPSIKEEMRRKLSECCFLVGSGTWQDLWAVKGGAKAAIGFHKPVAREMPDAIRAAGVIPTELLNRFHHEILLLEPMKASDFAEICSAEGLDAQAAKLGLVLDYDAAEASGLGMRWVEAQQLKICLARARESKPTLY